MTYASGREDDLDVALLGPNTTECIGTVERPDTLRAFFLILVYTAVFVAVALRIIQRRDVAGAIGLVPGVSIRGAGTYVWTSRLPWPSVQVGCPGLPNLPVSICMLRSANCWHIL